jgi:hypothetical protein
MEVNVQFHAPAASPLAKIFWFLLNRRTDESQIRKYILYNI